MQSVTITESLYAAMMLQALSHCAPGQRIFTGVNAGGTVADGEIISQGSTYPPWYGKLCEVESGDAIRRNLGLVADRKENRRGDQLTLGWRRVMKAVQFVMAEGDQESLIWPDPTFLHELGRHEEADSVTAYLQAVAEAQAETPDDLPTPDTTREFDLPAGLDPRSAAAIAQLAPYSSAIENRGWFQWPTPKDEESRQTLLAAGYKWAINERKCYGPPKLAALLPHRPCHTLPKVSYQPYR